MIDIKVQYQAIIFVNAQDIIPLPDIITSLLESFRDKAPIPNTFYEIKVGSHIVKTRCERL